MQMAEDGLLIESREPDTLQTSPTSETMASELDAEILAEYTMPSQPAGVLDIDVADDPFYAAPISRSNSLNRSQQPFPQHDNPEPIFRLSRPPPPRMDSLRSRAESLPSIRTTSAYTARTLLSPRNSPRPSVIIDGKRSPRVLRRTRPASDRPARTRTPPQPRDIVPDNAYRIAPTSVLVTSNKRGLIRKLFGGKKAKYGTDFEVEPLPLVRRRPESGSGNTLSLIQASSFVPPLLSQESQARVARLGSRPAQCKDYSSYATS